ncbi:hypothetical protein JHK84_052731 [Glycine max]|nr:hypothetical protein JHK85_053555 [Glycine max]KAG5082693.1 hypothetical protein JHK84_052731 [Glycine max]
MGKEERFFMAMSPSLVLNTKTQQIESSHFQTLFQGDSDPQTNHLNNVVELRSTQLTQDTAVSVTANTMVSATADTGFMLPEDLRNPASPSGQKRAGAGQLSLTLSPSQPPSTATAPCQPHAHGLPLSQDPHPRPRALTLLFRFQTPTSASRLRLDFEPHPQSLTASLHNCSSALASPSRPPSLSRSSPSQGDKPYIINRNHTILSIVDYPKLNPTHSTTKHISYTQLAGFGSASSSGDFSAGKAAALGPCSVVVQRLAGKHQLKLSGQTQFIKKEEARRANGTSAFRSSRTRQWEWRFPAHLGCLACTSVAAAAAAAA